MHPIQLQVEILKGIRIESSSGSLLTYLCRADVVQNVFQCKQQHAATSFCFFVIGISNVAGFVSEYEPSVGLSKREASRATDEITGAGPA